METCSKERTCRQGLAKGPGKPGRRSACPVYLRRLLPCLWYPGRSRGCRCGGWAAARAGLQGVGGCQWCGGRARWHRSICCTAWRAFSLRLLLGSFPGFLRRDGFGGVAIRYFVWQSPAHQRQLSSATPHLCCFP